MKLFRTIYRPTLTFSFESWVLIQETTEKQNTSCLDKDLEQLTNKYEQKV